MFPDARIEYELDGLDRTLDVEVVTVHYRGCQQVAWLGNGIATRHVLGTEPWPASGRVVPLATDRA